MDKEKNGISPEESAEELNHSESTGYSESADNSEVNSDVTEVIGFTEVTGNSDNTNSDVVVKTLIMENAENVITEDVPNTNEFTLIFSKIKQGYNKFKNHGVGRFNEIINRIIILFLAAYFFVNTYMLYISRKEIFNTDFKMLDYVKNADKDNVFVHIIFMFFGLAMTTKCFNIIFNKRYVRYDAYFLGISLTGFIFMTLYHFDNFYYTVGCVVVLAAMMFYMIKNDLLKELYKINTAVALLIVLVGAVIMCTFVATYCVYRYRIYYASNFDLGIAGQLYYYLKETFLPYTTCERDKLFSHFGVHITPCYYYLLPVYMLFPKMETLLIAQPIILALGAIPLFIICKGRKFSNAGSACMCLAYIFYLAVVSPNFYDFHENAFIPPLMLTFFCFYEKKKWVGMYIFLFLT
ncbi:MAG: DUF2079 domain-containing protein, partial [Oscillospiraceae bacterium]|nr:DUF2079 domain-containing protein [Oscillospiraceae bacterium]